MLAPPSGCPDQMQEVMKACWTVNPMERISFAEIVDKLESSSMIALTNPGYVEGKTQPQQDSVVYINACT